eukprot:4429977-Pyramimonas_sp.AAC.1
MAEAAKAQHEEEIAWAKSLYPRPRAALLYTPDTVVEPAEAEAVVEPAETEAVVEPAETDTVVEPAEAETVVEPAEAETVVEPAETEAVVEPAKAEEAPAAEPAAAKGHDKKSDFLKRAKAATARHHKEMAAAAKAQHEKKIAWAKKASAPAPTPAPVTTPEAGVEPAKAQAE